MNGVNLIPAHRVLARRRRARIHIWTVALGAFAVILGGMYAVMALAWGGSSAELQGRLSALDSQVSRNNDALRVKQKELAEKQAASQANSAVGEQPDWSMLLALLARTVQDDVVLESTALRPADATAKPAKAVTLSLSGLGRTHASVSDFVLRMEATRVFSRVTLLETRRTATAHAEAISFRVEAALSEEPR